MAHLEFRVYYKKLGEKFELRATFIYEIDAYRFIWSELDKFFEPENDAEFLIKTGSNNIIYRSNGLNTMQKQDVGISKTMIKRFKNLHSFAKLAKIRIGLRFEAP